MEEAQPRAGGPSGTKRGRWVAGTPGTPPAIMLLAPTKCAMAAASGIGEEVGLVREKAARRRRGARQQGAWVRSRAATTLPVGHGRNRWD